MSEKTEAPTPKRRADAAKRGDAVDVRELSTALGLVAGLGWLALGAPALWSGAKAVLIAQLSGATPAWSGIVLPLATLFAATMIAPVAARAVGGFQFAGHALQPKAEKLSPIAGLKRLFGPRGLTDFGKALLKLALLLGAAWLALGPLLGIMRHGASSTGDAFAALWPPLLAIGIGSVVVALIDAPIQVLLRTRRLRMSRQEVTDEHKEQEGSPENRRAAQERRHAMRSQSTRRAVAEASVVIVNPTHFAIALRYRMDSDAAPVIVARARAEAAAALRELAAAHGTPVLPYPELARALYFTGRIGRTIDERLYRAVAIVLAYVMGTRTAPPPAVDVPRELRFRPDGSRYA